MNPGAAPTSALSGPVRRDGRAYGRGWRPGPSGVGSGRALGGAGAALVALGAWALLVRAALATDDDPGIPPVQVLVGALSFGWPYMVAAPTAVVAASRVAIGVDAPAPAARVRNQRPTRPPGRVGCRHARRAREHHRLAARERLRFAAGCALIALRRGWGRSPWIVAAACVALFAALTVATSRASLDGSRAGSLWGVIYGPPQITLLLVGLVAAWTGRSMRTGLEHAIAALAGILLGILVAAIPEGALWAREAGVFILDGDAPSTPLSAAGGALDAVKSTTLIWGLPHWLPWPVLGAAAGARLRSRSTSTVAPTPAGGTGSRRGTRPSSPTAPPSPPTT